MNSAGGFSITDDNPGFTSDVIQLALREPPESAVHAAAMVIAQRRPERLYLDWRNKDITRGFHKVCIHAYFCSIRLLILLFLIKILWQFMHVVFTDTHNFLFFRKATILHHGSVEVACFLPDMTKLLTTNGDGQIKIWNATSGEVVHRFTGHRSSVKVNNLGTKTTDTLAVSLRKQCLVYPFFYY